MCFLKIAELARLDLALVAQEVVGEVVLGELRNADEEDDYGVEGKEENHLAVRDEGGLGKYKQGNRRVGVNCLPY